MLLERDLEAFFLSSPLASLLLPFVEPFAGAGDFDFDFERERLCSETTS